MIALCQQQQEHLIKGLTGLLLAAILSAVLIWRLKTANKKHSDVPAVLPTQRNAQRIKEARQKGKEAEAQEIEDIVRDEEKLMKGKDPEDRAKMHIDNDGDYAYIDPLSLEIQKMQQPRQLENLIATFEGFADVMD